LRKDRQTFRDPGNLLPARCHVTDKGRGSYHFIRSFWKQSFLLTIIKTPKWVLLNNPWNKKFFFIWVLWIYKQNAAEIITPSGEPNASIRRRQVCSIYNFRFFTI
jgi:hypothetical protein